MRVLSLFDGISGAQVALNQLGVKCEYYASEIDMYAIKVTQHNFTGTTQLGDVEKWREWNIDWNFDLVVFGSPCQGFSFSGKGLNFNDPRSKLFFTAVDILNHIKTINPKVYFLAENVRMLKKHQSVFNEYLGVTGQFINSSRVSAQHRLRMYWSNIKTKERGLFSELHTAFPLPKDRGILLKDILEQNVDEKYFITNIAIAMINRKLYSQPQLDPDKAGTINTKNNSGQLSIDNATGRNLRIERGDKSPALRSLDGCAHDNKIVTGVVNNKGVLREVTDGKSTCICVNYFKGMDNHARRTVIHVNPSTESNGNQPYQQNRIFDPEGLSPALLADMSSGTHAIVERDSYWKEKSTELMEFTCNCGFIYTGTILTGCPKCGGFGGYSNEIGHNIKNIHTNNPQAGRIHDGGIQIRRLTPLECDRLQTFPDNYTAVVSDTRRYQSLGNSFTVEVIKHELSFLPKELLNS